MEKLFIYDLETTGVMHWKNGIHQISGMIVIDGDVQEEFNFKVQPNPKAIIEKEALRIANVSVDQVMAYPEMRVVYNQLIDMLTKYIRKFDKSDKFHLMGYNNSSFDNQFLRAFFVQNQDNYFGSWFWSDTIDVMVLASQSLRKDRCNMENFKLMTVAKTLGEEINESMLHDASYDILLTYNIYKKLTA